MQLSNACVFGSDYRAISNVYSSMFFLLSKSINKVFVIIGVAILLTSVDSEARIENPFLTLYSTEVDDPNNAFIIEEGELFIGENGFSDPSDNPASYVILAEEKIEIKESTVNSGGLGVWLCDKELKIDDKSSISPSESFLRASVISDQSANPISSVFECAAPRPLEDALPYLGDPDDNLTIDENQGTSAIPYEIPGTDFKDLKIKKNNTVRFPEGTIYLNKFVIEDGDVGGEIDILFTGPTTIIVKEQLEIKKHVNFNSTGEADVVVVVHGGGDTKIGEYSSFHGTLDARHAQIVVKGNNAADLTSMTGHFIAKKVVSDKHVTWERPEGDYGILEDTYKKEDPASYVILVEKKAALENNTVVSGGIGSWSCGEEVKIEQNTIISSFVRASKIQIHDEIDNPDLAAFYSPAPLPNTEVPAYLGSSGEELIIGKNQGTLEDPIILDETNYENMKIGEGSIVAFTADTVYINKLETEKGDAGKEIQILFLQDSTVLIIKKELKFGEYTLFNPTEELQTKVIIHEGGATVEKYSSFFGSIDARNGKIEVKGEDEQPTTMTGQFIAKELSSVQAATWDINVDIPGQLILAYPTPSVIKTTGTLDPILFSLSEVVAEGEVDPSTLESTDFYQFQVVDSYTMDGQFFSGGEILVEVIALEGKEEFARNLAIQLGLEDSYDGLNDLLITGYIPIENLDDSTLR